MLSLLSAYRIFLLFRADCIDIFHKEGITYTKISEKYKTRNPEYIHIIATSKTASLLTSSYKSQQLYGF